MSKYKNLAIFAIACVVPGGFVALGAYKAYQIYQKKKLEKEQKPKTFEEYIAKLKAEVDETPE